MPDDIKLPKPAAWLVCGVNEDGSLYLVQAVAWKEAAHEHTNDAINEYDIKGAANWVVRAAYTADQVHAAIAAVEANRAQQAAEIERLRAAHKLIVRRHELEQHVELFGRDCDQETLMELYGAPAPHKIAKNALTAKGGGDA